MGRRIVQNGCCYTRNESHCRRGVDFLNGITKRRLYHPTTG